MKTKTKTKTQSGAKKKKVGIHHRIHRHIKKHLSKLKKKRPRLHKAIVLMSFTLPIVLGTVLFGSSALYYYESYFDNGAYAKEKITVSLPVVKDDTGNWRFYKDDFSGFSIKYPDRWNDPVVVNPNGDAKYLRKVIFSNGLDSSDKNYKEFEVSVYDAKKFSSPVETDNLIQKNPGTFTENNCDKAEFGEASLGEGDYPAQEVDISSDDQCFQETYFFSSTKGDYTYNIVPKTTIDSNSVIEGKKANIIAAFPKFFELISTIVLPQQEKVVEEKPVVGNSVIAPPHRTFIRLGRCPNKNDHPRKSRTKKHRHMDEDCCMDPDEWPNPRCQY